MVSETEVQAAPNSEAPAPPSEAVVAPPSPEAAAPPSQETSAQSTGEEAAKPEAKPLDGPALQAKVDAGEVLSTAEKETLRRHQQSEADRAARAAQIRQQQAIEAQRNAEEIEGIWSGLRTEALNTLAAEVKAAQEEGRDFSPTLLQYGLDQAVSKAVSKAKAHFELPIWRDLAQEVLQMGGDTPENREFIRTQDIASLRSLYRTLAYEQGRKTGPGEDGEFITAKAKAKLIEDAEKAGADKLKAANPEVYSNTNGAGIEGRGIQWRTKAEARNLHANNQISNAQMRAINADPTIPEGY